MPKVDPKSLGGGGFDFEDKVGAYFLSFLLTGTEFFPTLRLGRLRAIKFQARQFDWDLDDVVLQFISSQNLPSHCALSVKSFPYFTAKKAPEDLVASLWKQFSKEEPNPFQTDRDYLGVVTSGISPAASDAIDALRRLSEAHQDEDISVILSAGVTNKNVRQLFTSFAKPADNPYAGSINQASILRRFLNIDLDFDNPTSPDLKTAFANLNLALDDGDPYDLWIYLQNLAKTARVSGGEISFSKLAKELKDSFRLKGHFYLDADFLQLARNFAIEAGKIPSTIGKEFSIARDLTLPSQFVAGKINALIGESGIGKTVLVKDWAIQSGKPIIWLGHLHLKARSLTELDSLLGIRNTLIQLLEHGPSEQLVVIEGIDRLVSDEDLEIVKSLFQAIQDVISNRHYVVLTCQNQIWTKFVGSLSSAKIEFNVLEGSYLTEDELDSVAKQFPKLRALLKAVRTRQILKNLKYLDLAARLTENAELSPSSSLSEAFLISGFWNLVTDQGRSIDKTSCLLKLASQQADRNRFITPSTDFAESADVIEKLRRDGIIELQDGGIRFSHDLYGDWIRQKYLLNDKASVIQAACSKQHNVYWHQAIRLLSLEILEVQGFREWESEIKRLRSQGHETMSDLFLDVAITSLNQRIILDTVSPALFSDKFTLLQRFLERFLTYATSPNPTIMSLRNSIGISEVTAAQFDRIPLFSYWPNLIRFLFDNKDVIDGAECQIVQISERWLAHAPNNFPLRKEAAALVIKSAERMLNPHFRRNKFPPEDLEEKTFGALFAAFPDFPSEIKTICRKFVGLELANGDSEEPVIESEAAESFSTGISFRRRIEKKVWPNGPRFSKDRLFRDACCTNQNFAKIIRFDPEFACELILAALIEDPIEWEDFSSSNLEDDFGCESIQAYYPPSYSKGPFLAFFRLAPERALDGLIKLTAHATALAVEESIRLNTPSSINVPLNGVEKVWKGDYGVFCWPLGWSRCPNEIVSWLMAFEKWIYEQLETKADIRPWVKKVLEEADSVALLGLLSNFAKKHPRLFTGELKELLVTPEIVFWDQNSMLSGVGAYVDFINPESVANKMMREWSAMPHRHVYLRQWAVTLLVNFPPLADFFAAASKQLLEQAKRSADSATESFAHSLNISNYKFTDADDGSTRVEYAAPIEFADKNKDATRQNSLRLKLLSFPREVTKILESKTAIDQSVLHRLEEDVREFQAELIPSEDIFEIVDPQGCAIVIDALKLLGASRKSIEITPEDLEEAEIRVTRALASLCPDGILNETLFDRGETSWECQVALVLGQLASSETESGWFRHQVSLIALIRRSPALKTFVSVAAEDLKNRSFLVGCIALAFEREKIYTAFRDVARLTRCGEAKPSSWVDKVLTKNRFIRTRVFKRYTFHDRSQMCLQEVDYLRESFAGGGLERKWPKWDYRPEAYTFARGVELPERFKETFDCSDVLKTASVLTAARGSPDEGWIEFVCEGLMAITRRLSRRLEEDDELDGTPYRQERWVIRKFAETYLGTETYLGSGDPRLERGLVDFLRLGEAAHYWIEEFGKDLFDAGVQNPEFHSLLPRKLNGLFDLYLTVPSLCEKRGYCDEIWNALVGFGTFVSVRIPTGDRGILKALLPAYTRVLEIRTGAVRCLSHFVDILLSPAAIDIRLEGLVLVAGHLRGKDFGAYEFRNYTSSYSELLARVWEENRVDLQRYPDKWDAFQEVLHGLIKIQDGRALELASYVARTT